MNEAPVAVSETEALDAYSSTVTAVAQRVLPSAQASVSGAAAGLSTAAPARVS